MSNLLDLVKGQIGSAVISKLSSVIGASDSETSSAVDSFIPALLSGVIGNVTSKQDAGNLLDLISSNDLGGGMLDNLGDLLGGGSKTDTFMKLGGTILSSVFGSNQSSFLGKLVGLTNLGQGGSSKLLGLLAPIAMSVIGKVVKSKGLDAGGLLSFFGSQKSNIASALPLGFAAANTGGGSTERVAASTTTIREDNNGGGGMGWLKWLLPLLLLALLGWWFMGKKGDAKMDKRDGHKMEKVEGKKGKKGQKMKHDGHKHDGHSHDGHNHGDHKGHDHAADKVKSTDAKVEGASSKAMNTMYKIDKDGNIVDQYGFIIHSKSDVKADKDGNMVDANGTILIPSAKIKSVTMTTSGKKSPKLSVDANGNLVDASGKVLFKKGEFKQEGGYYVDSQGNKIGFFKKIGKAIGDAATATSDAFKKVFRGLFAADDKVGTSYKVTRMEFNKENHRLTYFSKQEFEGLVAALNEYPNRKLEVRVFTDDGKNEKENEKLSKARANVVRDMMATLMGTKKGNIDFKGMGSSDAAKAGKDQVEIYVAQ